MKRLTTIITAAAVIAISVLMPQSEALCAEKPAVSAKAAVLISADTGEVVYSVNSDEKLPMASTTKIMTTLLCLESGGLHEEFTVDSEAIKVEGSSMGLQEGDIVTKYALCCGMLLPSGNDAANAAAVAVSGSIEEFAKLMNERAKQIGMTRTFFVTPSGLDGEGHGSSACDMALLAREALKNEIFREICSSESIKLSFGNPPFERWLSNTNKLLTMCEGTYGVKTGFTDDAGRCLVSACERDGMELICVTLNDKNDWNDHIAMYDYGFDVVERRMAELPEEYFIDLAGGECEQVKLTTGAEPINITTASDDMSDFTYTVLSSPFAYAPVNNGEQLAELQIMYGDREVKRVPLYACGNYPAKVSNTDDSKDSGGFFGKIKSILGSIFS
ncbi:MAG: D-alanyl-D-alanine carboxypeptidase [Ruminococcus sp.]|nr:D-alanyl-D-alanine carboxypeptidase [Ruminococcus sp.]